MSNTFLDGNVYVNGTLGCKGAVAFPAGSITAAMINSLAGIPATALQHQVSQRLAQEYTATAAASRQVVHVCRAAGQLVEFVAGVAQVSTGNATITVKLRLGGTDVLNTDLTIDNTYTAYSLAATNSFTSATLAAGNVLEIDVSVNAGTGALGKGFFAMVKLWENAQ